MKTKEIVIVKKVPSPEEVLEKELRDKKTPPCIKSIIKRGEKSLGPISLLILQVYLASKGYSYEVVASLKQHFAKDYFTTVNVLTPEEYETIKRTKGGFVNCEVVRSLGYCSFNCPRRRAQELSVVIGL